MRAIAEMPHEVAAGIQVVLADIDDTITTEGRLTAEAYTALENLHNAGIRVAPVTGRPAGWCDMIARFCPSTVWSVKTARFIMPMIHWVRK
jgi:hypothetical protein